MGTHAQRHERDSNDGDNQDNKRMRRDSGGPPGSISGNEFAPSGMPPPGWQPVPAMPPGMQFFPGAMPPGMSPGRPPFPGGSLPPGMQAQP